MRRWARAIPAWGAAATGVVIAAVALFVPADLLEAAVWRTGLPSLVPVAAPPLGMTARAVLALGGGCMGAAIAWAALYLLFGPGGTWARTVATEAQPSVRWADAHPDAPPRHPLSMRDLAPAPPERPLPADLDQPLAAFDPAAVLPVPMQPQAPVAALATPLQAGERIETFDLSARARDEGEPTIEQLLARLEGARRPVRVQ